MAYLVRLMVVKLELLEIGRRIQFKARDEINKAGSNYHLRRQLKAGQKELGENRDDNERLIQAYQKKIEKAHMPEKAKEEALRELSRLAQLRSECSEYTFVQTYLDWIVELPWNKLSQDDLDIVRARDILNVDHYGLNYVKERILEYLAAYKLHLECHIDSNAVEVSYKPNPTGTSILLFVGPPGVGKTSIGRSIARALGRKFTRIGLGGVTDEAQIRGYRRTYISAMPGLIIQSLRRVKTRNPVFMLDEVDKVGKDGQSNFSNTLLEVLDPQRNCTFFDHYLNVSFDLSHVIFIAAANTLEPIPISLLDRMEIIYFEGYTEAEKVEIAKSYLVPRQIKVKGLYPQEIHFTELGLCYLIRAYAPEIGLCNLERQIGRITSKVAVKVASGDWIGNHSDNLKQSQTVMIDPHQIQEFLGKAKSYPGWDEEKRT